jgi:starch synthase (maltosyl-transferring)
MQLRESPQIIYNLFPRLFRSIDKWTDHLSHIEKLDFNAVYVNPFHSTGGSRSLYAVKDYYKVNEEFLVNKSSDGFSELRSFLCAAEEKNMAVYMDLVINHTANESVLVSEYPNWYKRDQGGNLIHPYAIDPANPSNVTVWGDLAEINYDNNPDFDNLRAYWDKLISFYQELGFAGFRCDAAYKVPCSMWQPLIAAAKQRKPGTLFLAETLGCTFGQMEALGSCGFDFFFNSSKWWNFEGQWCIDQHAAIKRFAPSISFPESHDTDRVAGGPPGSLEWQKNRYVLSAVFSQGLLMPIGYEFGSTAKLDVVNSRPEQGINGRFDISDWIKQVNGFKKTTPMLLHEGTWEPVWGFDDHLLCMMRTGRDASQLLGFIVNKDWYNGTTIDRSKFPWQFGRFNKVVRLFDQSISEQALYDRINLAPSEIILLTD